MKNSKKLIALLVAVMVVAVLAMGCSAAQAPAEAAPVAEPAPVEEATAEPVAEPAATEEVKEASTSSVVWPSAEELFVGYSQADLASTWRTVESDDMEIVAKERGYEFAITNAEGDTERQISDVESLLAQGCNVMVITAIDADAIQPALDACKAKGVPVIMKSRGANGVAGEDFTSFVASDFVWEGEQAGKWIADATKAAGIDPVKVAEIQGVIGGSDVRDRGQGFANAAEAAGNFEVVAQQSANWSRTEAQALVQNILQSTGGEIDAIYCQNDEMALGASLALQAAGLEIGKDVYLVGVDGMIEALDAIKAGTLSATITCNPRFANTVFDIIEKGMGGEEIEAFVPVDDKVVDITNVDEFYQYGF